MKRLKKLQELHLLFKQPELAQLLEADAKTVRRWLYTEEASIHQQRHKDNIDKVYEASKAVIKMKRANVKRNYGW